ncbi:MAG: RNA 2'-phosphotransferase, partial [Candidatus Thermoplasmatota archaeon]|nr:RNA 2'-phosphotransferase [Candidatus Thermoplasmatota archaeon]
DDAMNHARGREIMLRQCREHGHFSGTNCPVCNEEGKFIMSDREANSVGRILALVLRHAPEKFNVDMDINGWVETRELSKAIADSRRHLHWVRAWHFEAIANADEKGRWQVENEMIRATYGHSIEIELDLPTDDIPEALYWPCEASEVESLLKFGILSGDRKHIHLSRTIANALEAGHVRIGRPSIIEVDTIRAIADGHTIYRAGTTVFLTDEVPPSALYPVGEDDPIVQETFARWDEEE